jgi:Uma2 family endonuclease
MSTVIERSGDEAAVAGSEEQRILLEGISWDRFEQLSACFQDTRSVRLTYLDGRLEIVSPVGREHEDRKRRLSYLLETYLDQAGIRFYGRGGFTLKQPERAAGEPDESYCIGSDKPLPDLAMEVVVTSDALSKLPLYQALGIAEVWIWRKDDLEVYVLDAGTYRRSTTSRLFPGLDIPLLAAHARMPDQYDAVRAYRRAIASGDADR